MLKSFLLILLAFCSLCFAQTETSKPKPVAEKIEEFGVVTDGYVKMVMDSFYIDLNNNPSAQGYIINYGLPREIAKRRAQIAKSIAFRRYDGTRITFVEGGFRPKIKTEFWLVPLGAENPKPQITARQIDEFERATSGEIKARMDNFYIELYNNEDSAGYIVNYGTKRQVDQRVNQIKRYIAGRKYDASRVKFINDGTGKTIKTEFWIDAETP